MVTLDTGTVFAILLGLAALIVAIVGILLKHGTPAQVQAEVLKQLAALQSNRPQIGALETAYANTPSKGQLNTAIGALKTVALVYHDAVLDAAIKLLEDIQTPGEPSPDGVIKALAESIPPSMANIPLTTIGGNVPVQGVNVSGNMFK